MEPNKLNLIWIFPPQELSSGMKQGLPPPPFCETAMLMGKQSRVLIVKPV